MGANDLGFHTCAVSFVSDRRRMKDVPWHSRPHPTVRIDRVVIIAIAMANLRVEVPPTWQSTMVSWNKVSYCNVRLIVVFIRDAAYRHDVSADMFVTDVTTPLRSSRLILACRHELVRPSCACTNFFFVCHHNDAGLLLLYQDLVHFIDLTRFESMFGAWCHYHRRDAHLWCYLKNQGSYQTASCYIGSGGNFCIR